MAADQRALAAIEIDMNVIPEGQVVNYFIHIFFIHLITLDENI
jgi:hypothetical protein